MKVSMCDRCRVMINPADSSGGELNVSELDPLDNTRRGPREYIGDICSSCVSDLKAWIRTPKNHDQPKDTAGAENSKPGPESPVD